MNILILTIAVTFGLVMTFILIFLGAVRSDQFEDLETPAHFPFTDDSSGDEREGLEQKQDDGFQEISDNHNLREGIGQS